MQIGVQQKWKNRTSLKLLLKNKLINSDQIGTPTINAQKHFARLDNAKVFFVIIVCAWKYT